MEKIDYVKKLKSFTEKQGISYHEYFEQFAKRIRSEERLDMYAWEIQNPFLGENDLQTVLYTGDERVVSAYADAMTTTILEFEKKNQRAMIKEVIEEQIEALSRGEIVEAIEEQFNLVEPKVVEEAMNLETINQMNGFAVMRENKETAHLYYFDGETSSLNGETMMTTNAITAGSGYYVNYEEFVNQLLDSLLTKYPTMEEVTFVREDGEVRTKEQILEEAFQILKNRGALRFGTTLDGKELKSFQELVSTEKRKEKYKGYPLQTGLYVRRDYLRRIFSKFKMKITLKKEEEKSPTK